MGAIITKIGLKKIASATVDNPLKIEKFAVGDGGGNKISPNEDMRSLVGEKYRDFINHKYTNNTNTVFESVLRANAKIKEGFYIRELGLFDEAGDLIVVTDLPLQYRAATKEGDIVTELLFNIAIQVDNSDVIEIKLHEQAFATVYALNILTNTVNELINSRNKFIESCVGIEKLFNTDNSHKDKNILNIGVKIYALMDESNILLIKDYPILFRNIKGVDRGDGTFAMPKFHDGTIRHVKKNSNRGLGSFEEDTLQTHTHSNTHRHMMHPHHHPIDDIRGSFGSVPFFLGDGVIRGSNGGFFIEGDLGLTNIFVNNSLGNRNVNRTVFSSHKAGVKTTNMETSTMSDTSITTDEGNARKSEETRMKNTSGQWYLLAKINM